MNLMAETAALEYHHFNVRSPRSDPINYWLTYYQIADLTL